MGTRPNCAGGERVTLVLIGMAGAAGAVARLVISGWVAHWRQGSVFPWGTFAVNTLGSFLLGLVMGMFLGRGAISPEAKAVLGTGFLGALTTFSTWQMETYRLYRRGDRLNAWANLLLSTAAGLMAAWLGLALGWSL